MKYHDHRWDATVTREPMSPGRKPVRRMRKG